MKRLITVVILFSLLTNTFANSNPAELIRDIVKQTTYELSQLESLEDLERNKVLRNAKSKLEKLKNSDLTQEEILNLIKEQIKDSKSVKEIEMISRDLDINQMPENEFFNLVVKRIENSQATGSNYSGSTYAMLSVVFVILLVVLVANAESCEDKGLQSVRDCRWEWGNPIYDEPDYVCYTICV